MDYNELIDDVKGSCYSLHACKEGCETLQQQWMSLLASQHHISHVERVPTFDMFYAIIDLTSVEMAGTI